MVIRPLRGLDEGSPTMPTRRIVCAVLVLVTFLQIFAFQSVQAQPFGPRMPWPFVAWFSPKPTPPQPPFTLRRGEQKRLDGILAEWEKRGKGVKSFSCRFTRWSYDISFGPKNNDFLMAERHGELKFRAPDSAVFCEKSITQFDPSRDEYVISRDDLEYWICDGKSIYCLRSNVRTIDITRLPDYQIGRATCDGPMPFLFPIDAKAMHERFWIRESTPRKHSDKQLWLEAWPRAISEATQVQRVEVILALPDYSLVGMQVTAPNGKDRTAYLLEKLLVNEASAVNESDFEPPPSTADWHRVAFPTSPKPKESASVDRKRLPILPVPCIQPTISPGQNRSRGERGGLLESRPGLPRFCFRGRFAWRYHRGSHFFRSSRSHRCLH